MADDIDNLHNFIKNRGIKISTQKEDEDENLYEQKQVIPDGEDVTDSDDESFEEAESKDTSDNEELDSLVDENEGKPTKKKKL